MAIVAPHDERVVLTGDHEGGMPSVFVETEDPEVLAWARATFDDIYERSHPLSEAV